MTGMARSGSREDTGSGTVCNDLAAGACGRRHRAGGGSAGALLACSLSGAARRCRRDAGAARRRRPVFRDGHGRRHRRTASPRRATWRASTASAARSTAIVERLAGGRAKAKLPKLDDNAITDLVASFEVANERMSAVRYIADYTFHFRPADVQRVLQMPASPRPAAERAGRAKARPPAAGGKRGRWCCRSTRSGDDGGAVGRPNPWRDAWAAAPAAGAPRLIVPLGDVGDLAAIDADKARAGDGDGAGRDRQANTAATT